MTEQTSLDVDRWPRLGALVTRPDRAGIWSVWSRGADVVRPNDSRKWWLVPVDATEAERAEQAVLVHEDDFTEYGAGQAEMLT